MPPINLSMRCKFEITQDIHSSPSQKLPSRRYAPNINRLGNWFGFIWVPVLLLVVVEIMALSMQEPHKLKWVIMGLIVPQLPREREREKDFQIVANLKQITFDFIGH